MARLGLVFVAFFLAGCSGSFNFKELEYRPADVSGDTLTNRVQTHEQLRDKEAVSPYSEEKKLRDSTLEDTDAEENPDVEVKGVDDEDGEDDDSEDEDSEKDDPPRY